MTISRRPRAASPPPSRRPRPRSQRPPPEGDPRRRRGPRGLPGRRRSRGTGGRARIAPRRDRSRDHRPAGRPASVGGLIPARRVPISLGVAVAGPAASADRPFPGSFARVILEPDPARAARRGAGPALIRRLGYLLETRDTPPSLVSCVALAQARYSESRIRYLAILNSLRRCNS